MFKTIHIGCHVLCYILEILTSDMVLGFIQIDLKICFLMIQFSLELDWYV